jgi:hypothetical protein
MSVELIVNNIPYLYPSDGQPPGWGEQATEWAQGVTDVLNDLLAPNDILETSFTIQNNIAVATNIAGLQFNTAQVRSATIHYSIYRTSTLNPSGKAESGTMEITFDNAGSSGNKWALTVYGTTGNSGVNFSITDLGQFQYTSTDIDSAGYSGTMRFQAKTTTSV